MEYLREARKSGITTPVLLLTVKESTKNKIEGLDSGADDYLTKPFSFEELTARARALLRRKNYTKENILSVGNITLNLVEHTVTISGKEIILTPKEYSILDFLLRNKNKIVSRTRLVEHVYDYHFDSGTNVIDVYINKLRNKLNSEGNQQIIQTIRGIGYVIKE